MRRGEGRAICAVLLLGDLRGFTRLTERLPRASVIDVLNRWFEILEKVVVAHDGEVLKFMGDGLLAMFPMDRGREAETCSGAVAAVTAALPRLDTLVAELRRTAQIPAGYGLTLHAGTVVYGNVGGRERLDFTVIGPAVNRVSRLQEVAKRLGEPVLATSDVARLMPERFASLGSYPLRDLDGSTEVFRLTA
jgi:adenylate cyclase